MLEIALAALALVLILRYLLHSRYNFWKIRGFPCLQPTFPFGNCVKFSLLKEFIGDAYQEVYKQIGSNKYTGIFVFLKPILVVKDLEEIKNVLTRDFDHFNNRDEDTDRSLEIIGLNLFHMQDYQKWKFLRSNLIKTFSSTKMKMMFQDMVTCSNLLISKLDQKIRSPVEIKELFSDYTTEVAFSCFFGLKANAIENDNCELREVRRVVIEPVWENIFRSFLSALSSKLPLFCKVRVVPKFCNDFFTNFVQQLIEHRENENVSRPDLFNILLDLWKQGSENPAQGKGLEFDMMAAQCLVFYIASFETSSFTIASCLHALAHYPALQDKVVDEIETVISNHDGKLTYEAIQEMKYLDQVISETLRLFTPVPELMRRCTTPYTTTDGHVIEKDVRVVIPVYAIHRDENLYPNPELFDPERFNDENSKNRHKYAYLPFGHGPRSCIGMRFGLLQAKLGIVSVLSKYIVHPDDKSPFPPTYSPKIFVSTVNPDGFWMKLQKRYAVE